MAEVREATGHGLGERLANGLPAIMSHWVTLTDKPPWTSLTVEEHVDHLPDLMAALILLAVGDGVKSDAREQVVVQGYMHGVHRRISGFEMKLLLQEYHILRHCIWECLAEEPDQVSALAAILRIDNGITVATIAGMVAFASASDVDEPDDAIRQSLLARWA